MKNLKLSVLTPGLVCLIALLVPSTMLAQVPDPPDCCYFNVVSLPVEGTMLTQVPDPPDCCYENVVSLPMDDNTSALPTMLTQVPDPPDCCYENVVSLPVEGQDDGTVSQLSQVRPKSTFYEMDLYLSRFSTRGFNA